MVTPRLTLRRWAESDREPFAALNADSVVMEYFSTTLDRQQSDALIDRIERNFERQGFGLWAVQVAGDFIGFTGLAVADEPPLGPAVEVGWRLARSAWGHGYATEAARAALDFGFGSAGLTEIVSFTSKLNLRSAAVMRRLGMQHDPADDFDHPHLPAGHRLLRQVRYRITAGEWASAQT